MQNEFEIVTSAELEASRPRVSVHMITYKHEGFIRQAVESALNQQTNFPYEVIVGEDCSPDSTRKILRELQKAHPDRLKLILPVKNVGALTNSIAVMNASRGEYMAFVEGDDYWTDPHKLQKQVDLLDAHPDCVLCHHRIQAVEGTTGEVKYEYPFPEDRLPFQNGERFFALNFVQTCSVMLRKKYIPEFDADFMKLPLGDYPFFILLCQHGQVAYLDEIMAHYRLHGGGAYSAMRPGPKRAMATFSVMEYLAGTPKLKRPWRVLALRRSNAFLEASLGVIRETGGRTAVRKTLFKQAGRAMCLMDMPTLWLLAKLVVRKTIKMTGLVKAATPDEAGLK